MYRTTHIIAFILLSMLLLGSCRTQTQFVDREVIRYEKQYIYDSIYLDTHDSVYHSVVQKGDTIYDTKYIERTKWRDRVVVKTDTLVRDSVKTETKETVVEKQIIPKWCYVCLAACVIFSIFAAIKVLRWLQMF